MKEIPAFAFKADCPGPGSGIYRGADGRIIPYGVHVDGPLPSSLPSPPSQPDAKDLCLDSGDGDGTPYLEPCMPYPPLCVRDPAKEHHYVLVYTHLQGTPDNYAQVAPVARQLLALANGNIRYEASLFGIQTTLKAQCYPDGPLAGQPVVHDLEVGSSPYSSVMAAYHEPNARYMVLMDPMGGQSSSSWIADDSPGLSNLHNFAPNYGFVRSWSVGSPASGHGAFLHELGHGLGGVSSHAPHSLPGQHCGDGYDVMCYDTWVSNGDFPRVNPHREILNRVVAGTPTHLPVYCTDIRHFDCNHDDYFNPKPEPSPLPGVLPDNYLLDHWNVGNPANLFIQFSTKAAPHPSIHAPTTGATDAPLAFDGTGTQDPDGDALASFEWDFGDGGAASGATAEHRYAAPGTYTVRLSVYDAYEGWNTTAASVSVAPNQAPNAAFTLPQKEHAGTPVVFDAAPSSDADGSIVSYRWDFGDGSTAAGPSVSHAFQAPGPVEVTLTVTDDSGATGTATHMYVVLG